MTKRTDYVRNDHWDVLQRITILHFAVLFKFSKEELSHEFPFKFITLQLHSGFSFQLYQNVWE